MKLDISITLDSGGTIHITGEELTGEDMQEVFKMLSDTDHTFDGVVDPITDDMKTAFVEGFDEGRTQQQENT